MVYETLHKSISRNTGLGSLLAWATDTRPGAGETRCRATHIQSPHSHTDSGTYSLAGSFAHYGKLHRYTHSLFPQDLKHSGDWIFVLTTKRLCDSFALLYITVKKYVRSLTCTHSFFVPRLVSAVVTVKSFMIVTGISFITGLPHLLGTGLAAVTSICQQADPMWANRGTLRALTGPFTVTISVVSIQICGHKRRVCGVVGTGLCRREERNMKKICQR